MHEANERMSVYTLDQETPKLVDKFNYTKTKQKQPFLLGQSKLFFQCTHKEKSTHLSHNISQLKIVN